MNCWYRWVSVFLCVCLLGCTTTRPIQVPYSAPEALAEKVAIGDDLEIVHESGRILRFKVERIDQWSVSGNGNTILWESIEKLRIREFSKGKTAGAAAAGAGTAVAVVGVLTVLAVLALGEAFEGIGEVLGCMFGCRDDDED